MAVQKVCESCGGAFEVPPRRAESVRFCSQACKTAAGRLRLTCATCGGMFERVKSSQARSGADYCGLTCYRASIKGRKNATPEAVRYFKTCQTCGTDFRVTKTRVETARFCSRTCQSANPAWRQECSEKQQAEKHWRWSGGQYRTQEGYIRHRRQVLGAARFTYNHRIVVAEAMERDAPGHPFLTNIDGKVRLRPEIEVHHIDRNRENNSLENLLAVTKAAHAQIHHRGRKPDPWECWPQSPAKW